MVSFESFVAAPQGRARIFLLSPANCGGRRAKQVLSPRAAFPLAERLRSGDGVPLGELWYLHELAAWLREHGRSRFLLTAPPLRLPGAVASPLTPIATV